MTTADELRRRIVSALEDGEIVRLSPSLDTAVAIAIGEQEFRLVFRDGRGSVEDSGAAGLRLSASVETWALALLSPPPPRYHAFTAFQLANPEFSFSGDPKSWAQARPALERLFELVATSTPAKSPAVRRDLTQISGRYEAITVDGTAYDVFCEEAGQGTPVLFLHTAGADGRQYLGQLADVELAKRFRMIAVDMPFHGRSLPPRTWRGDPYRLTTELYRSWCSAILEKFVGEPAIVVGGSMGAAMAMVLAADCPNQVRGIVAVEPPYRSKGRRNPFQNHVEVHGSLHNSSFVRGLMSPTSPEEDRRRASWIYAQAAPGIYNGDLSFYSDEFDGELVAPRIDGARTPIALLSGTYDYSATPEDGARLARLIKGSLFVTMEGLGHFPMCENPDLFRRYLVQGLDFILAADRAEPVR
ncbi:MAG: alpha/beta hydrolase [Mesorhizobium sp.]|nr:alpha/beta hydrolase [Mesorhizobium sp.]